MAALLVQCSFPTPRTLTMGVLNGRLTRPVFFSNTHTDIEIYSGMAIFLSHTHTDDGGVEWLPYSCSVLFQRRVH